MMYLYISFNLSLNRFYVFFFCIYLYLYMSFNFPEAPYFSRGGCCAVRKGLERERERLEVHSGAALARI